MTIQQVKELLEKSKRFQLVADEPLPEPPDDFESSDAPLPPWMSEDALADKLVNQHGQVLRWTHGMGWMIDNSQVWQRDADMVHFDRARGVCRLASSDVDDEKLQRKVTTAATVAAVVKLAQTDPRIVVPVSSWDADPLALNTPGGIVDLRTGAMRPRGADDYVTQVTTVAPDIKGVAPVFERFMLEIFTGDTELVSFMQRALGYCLTGDRREQVLLFAHGDGANGKSTFIDLVRKLAGTYATNLPADELMASRNEKHKTGIASLRGRRMAVSSELEEGQFWNESLLKSLTGDETMSARFMRQDFFEFTMTHKHLIVGNFKPRLRGGDPAMARRLLLIPFAAKFEGDRRDKLLGAKLLAEAPAILGWIIRGAVKWHSNGLLPPERVRAASAEYLAEHDDLALWAEECCHRSGEGRASDLYASFSLWKQSRGEHASSMTSWGSRVAGLPGLSKRKSHGTTAYTGLSLRSDELEKVNAARR